MVVGKRWIERGVGVERSRALVPRVRQLVRQATRASELASGTVGAAPLVKAPATALEVDDLGSSGGCVDQHQHKQRHDSV